MRPNRSHLCAAALLLPLAGCAVPRETALFERQPATLRFAQPDTGSLYTVELPPGTSAQTVAARLKGLGFGVTRLSAEDGVVEARTTEPVFVDCGKITQRVFGNRSTIEGAAPLSIIYTNETSADFVTREVTVDTKIRVRLQGRTAEVTDTHDVRISWGAANGRNLGFQSKTVAPGSRARFADGTACASSSRIAERLR